MFVTFLQYAVYSVVWSLSHKLVCNNEEPPRKIDGINTQITEIPLHGYTSSQRRRSWISSVRLYICKTWLLWTIHELPRNAKYLDAKGNQTHGCICKRVAGPGVDMCWLYLRCVPSCINCTSASLVSPCHWFSIQILRTAYWGRDKAVAILQTLLNQFFMNEKFCIVIEVCSFLGVQLTVTKHQFR